jgi:hypothetical protein
MSIFTVLPDEDIVEANPTTVTSGIWSGETGSLESDLYIYGTQADSSGEYYLDVYAENPSGELAEPQFAITYGHINGAGAPTLVDNEQGKLPTKAIYSQYRNLLLDPSETKFKFEGVESDHIYVINFQRARYKEQLDAGNWQLPLSGARGISTFIDDSNQTLGALTGNSKAGRVFSVVSGTLDTTSGSITASSNPKTWGDSGPGYGLVYPDLGIIVLNPNAIGPAVGFFTTASSSPDTVAPAASFTGSSMIDSSSVLNTLTKVKAETVKIPYAPLIDPLADWGTNLSAYNHNGLYVSLQLAVASPAYVDGFRARSAETISSTHYFVRLRNRQYNYSNNPTFYNPDNGAIIQSDFKQNPRVYITTVGLFNDQNELLAVAKLSKPVPKSFDEEVLLRVRLDF